MDSHPSRSCGSSHDETDINITEPSILTNAHHFTINHAHFAASNGTDIVQLIHDFCKGYYEPRSLEGQGNKSQVMLSMWMGLLQFLLRLVLSKIRVGGHLFEDLDQQDLPDIPKNALTLQENIKFREGARFHSAIASYKVSKVKAVMVQIFEGPDARLLWNKTVQSSNHLLNPHLLKIIGISPSLDEDLHYIVFDGSYKRDTSQLIASLLREGNTREIMVVGSQIVYGIASGIDYISQATSASMRVQDFDIFSDDLGKTVVSFSPGKNQEERKDNNASIICNSLMSKLFHDANHILYRDFIQLSRFEDDLQVEAEEHQPATVNQTSQASAKDIDDHGEGGEGSSMVHGLIKTSHRREIVWLPSKLIPLPELSKTYSDLLRCYTQDPTQRSTEPLKPFPLFHHTGTRKSGTMALHNCEGYVREEIMLTPDAFKNAVLVFKKPTLGEICVSCGKQVQLGQPDNTSLTWKSQTSHVCMTIPSIVFLHIMALQWNTRTHGSKDHNMAIFHLPLYMQNVFNMGWKSHQQ
ncbi:hypothetical protein C8J55DRAFT_606646 [Lentinula edodes]|uniref:Uncharacterized protein n=1 Tax=Lentinula lateritia TaxID=40482 RepID=A0A9W9A8D2_9AGAR|nr:hypothetical protein C8J55DRAFT_606646 [Lentinula edodes]